MRQGSVERVPRPPIDIPVERQEAEVMPFVPVFGAGSRATRWLRYGWTATSLIGVTALLVPLRDSIGLLGAALIYLAIIIGATLRGGQRTGLFAAVFGFGLFDFFLVHPSGSFWIEEWGNGLALFGFLGMSALISRLIAGVQAQAIAAQRHAEDVSRLYELNQAVLEARRPADVLPAIAGKIVTVFGVQACWILLADDEGHLTVEAAAPPGVRDPRREELTLAAWALRPDTSGGRRNLLGSRDGQLRDGRTAYVPLCTANRAIGVLVVADKSDRRPLTASEQTALATFADQTVVALERLELLAEAARAETLARTDELKSALMAAVSHDLRTPLASIIASVTSLQAPEIELDPDTQADLLDGIYEQAIRLNRLVGNLLDMSRIEGGALRPDFDWNSLDEVIEGVVERLEPRLATHPVTLDIEPNLPLLWLDYSQIDQVLTNLVENALKYTPDGTQITIGAHRCEGQVEVTVRDNGPGVGAEHLPYLFDKFYRATERRADTGTGLGLAISRGLVQAHNGTLTAISPPGEGLTMRFTLPIGEGVKVEA
jgi:two-component system sensor histidine kinase KdpD